MPSIYIDIETIPGQAAELREEIAATIKPPANYKLADSIAKWEAEHKAPAAEKAWLDTALDAAYGQVVCVSMAAADDEPTTYVASDLGPNAERKLLSEVFAALERQYGGTHGLKPVLVGHNLIGFDLPFLWRRAVVHGVPPPFWWPRNAQPWSDAVFDTMLTWAGARGTIGLDRLCRVLGLAGKTMSGADVWPAVRDGRLADVARYCADDVRATRELHRRLTFAPAQVPQRLAA